MRRGRAGLREDRRGEAEEVRVAVQVAVIATDRRTSDVAFDLDAYDRLAHQVRVMFWVVHLYPCRVSDGLGRPIVREASL